MARLAGKDRGITQRKDRKGWWVRLYMDGRERWFRCDTKSQAKALYGRLKGEQREGKYFDKQGHSIPSDHGEGQGSGKDCRVDGAGYCQCPDEPKGMA